MRRKLLVSLSLAQIFVALAYLPVLAYPERPESARVWYEIEYFPVRLISMFVTTAWDVPTASFQDGVKGAIGATRMVSRNVGNEHGTYELVAGGVSGGPVGFAAGATYGVMHGFAYGVRHGFVGYPSPHSGSHSMLFQGRGFVVPYDDNY